MYFLFGFGLMFGYSQSGWFGTNLFLLSDVTSSWDQAFFIFELMFCGTAVTIVSGAIAERIKFSGYLLITCIISGIIFPIYGHWAWNGLNEATSSG
jgi:Amt family ammonium transporter